MKKDEGQGQSGQQDNMNNNNKKKKKAFDGELEWWAARQLLQSWSPTTSEGKEGGWRGQRAMGGCDHIDEVVA